MLINVKGLWETGGYGADNPLERTLAYVKKKGVELKVPETVVNAIISKTFIGLQNGDTYSTTECRCGCGIDKSGTDITHHMIAQVVEMGKTIEAALNKTVEDEINTMISDHFQKNKMKPINPLMDWDRSPINKLRKWAFRIK